MLSRNSSYFDPLVHSILKQPGSIHIMKYCWNYSCFLFQLSQTCCSKARSLLKFSVSLWNLQNWGFDLVSFYLSFWNEILLVTEIWFWGPENATVCVEFLIWTRKVCILHHRFSAFLGPKPTKFGIDTQFQLSPYSDWSSLLLYHCDTN